MQAKAQVSFYCLFLFLFACSSPNNVSKEDPVLLDIQSLYHYFVSDPKINAQIEQNAIVTRIVDLGLSAYRTEQGIYYTYIEKGSGPILDSKTKHKAHYVGRFLNGETFDSSYKKKKPLSFKLKGMIKAWRLILPNVPSGSKLLIWTPSLYAYGKVGIQNLIPGKTPLEFEIELID